MLKLISNVKFCKLTIFVLTKTCDFSPRCLLVDREHDNNLFLGGGNKEVSKGGTIQGRYFTITDKNKEFDSHFEG